MGIFYEIINSEGKKSYLYGTIHQNDVELVTLPLEVKKALDSSEQLILEADINMAIAKSATTIASLQSQWIEAEKENHHHFSKAYLKDAKKFLIEQCKKQNIAFWMYTDNQLTEEAKKLCPISIVFSKQKFDSSKLINALDQQLLNYAQNRKTVHYLEDWAEQLKIVLNYHLTLPQQMEFYNFMQTPDAQNKILASQDKLKSAYLQNDLKEMRKITHPFESNTQVPEGVTRYYSELFDKRDVSMASSMEKHIQNGNAFVAVGAGHLQGIVTQLTKKGYTINPLRIGTRCAPISGTVEDGKKVAAFRMIYTALYAGQSSLFKKKGLFSDPNMIVSMEQIQKRAKKSSGKRTAEAWRLANIHFQSVSCTNTELFTEIHKYSYKHSSFLFFKKTNISHKNEIKEIQINEALPTSRTGKIRTVLNALPY